MNDEPRNVTGQTLRGCFRGADIEVLLIRVIANCRHIDKYKHSSSTYVIRAFASDEKMNTFSPFR